MAAQGALYYAGARDILNHAFRGLTVPSNFYLALCQDNDVVWNRDHDTWSDISTYEVAAGNGYTANGQSIAKATLFASDAVVTADLNAYIRLANVSWTASGGTLPSTGYARYLVLMDENATPANRKLYAAWDLAANRQVASGQTLTVQNSDLQIGHGTIINDPD
ncbi:MAG: hypothetical protein IT340_19935 [Chloroflexi bacterium]|nr:hypothetical protein [Chloroflexota bacterium]